MLIESGASVAAVGERFGVAARTVLNAFRNAGVPTRPVGTNQWGAREGETPVQSHVRAEE